MISIRVYGILINEKKQILVSDELIKGNYFTKFPGGGLEQGEGNKDCLKREFLEEMSLKISVENHIYTTDFFQRSAFNANHQIIAIYYFVKMLEPLKIAIKNNVFEFDDNQLKIYESTQQIESFRFINWENFTSKSVTLPIDKIVAEIIKSSIN